LLVPAYFIVMKKLKKSFLVEAKIGVNNDWL
jgi:hypothetical protein